MKTLTLALLTVAAFTSFSFMKPPSPKLSKLLVFPVAGKKSNIGSFWGDDRDGGRRKHRGIDIFAKKGTPVVAISDGIVILKSTTPRGGKVVWLRTLDYPLVAYYAHLDKHSVKQGQYVKKGQVLGTVGNTGNARTTPSHLHFGIYSLTRALNPLPYVRHSPRVPIITKRA